MKYLNLVTITLCLYLLTLSVVYIANGDSWGYWMGGASLVLGWVSACVYDSYGERENEETP